jgi:hypothetical protein
MLASTGIRNVAAASLALLSFACLAKPSQAYPFPIKFQKRQPVYFAQSPTMMPQAYGAAPMTTAAAPVFVGAISTATAANYYSPAMTANAPYYTTATTANAPVMMVAPQQVSYASAPASNVAADSSIQISTTLPQDDLCEIYNALRTENEKNKKDTPKATERRDKLVEKAKALIGDKRVVEPDNLEEADQRLADQLALIVVKGKVPASLWGCTQGFGSAPVANSVYYSSVGQAPAATSVIYQTGMAPATTPMMYQPVGAAPTPMLLYPVQLTPVMAKPCGHRFWCNCPRTYP